MNTFTSRAAVLSGSVALASALVFPASALASENASGNTRGGSSSANASSSNSSNSASNSNSNSASKDQAQGENSKAQSEPAPRSSQGAGKPAKSEKAEKAQKAEKAEKAERTKKSNNSGSSSNKPAKADKPAKAQESAPKPAKADPAGNNGTIKIQPLAGIAGNSNSPHPGCDFRLQMFNFDANQTGTITFAGQAPTTGAVTAQPLAGTRLLSNDAAGGGQDADAFYDVSGASLGLTGAPHAKQGYHIKVFVDADNAPGGAKQKVFWLNCPATATTSNTSSSTAGIGDEITGVSTTGLVGPEVSSRSGLRPTTKSTAPVFGPPTGLEPTTVELSGTQTSEVTGVEAAAVQAAPEAANETGFVGSLPFTGAAGITALLLLGAGALLGGFGLVQFSKARSI